MSAAPASAPASTSNLLRVVALIAAALIFVACLASVAVITVTGHLGDQNTLLAQVIGIAVIAIPSLLTFAHVQTVKVNVNGNMSAMVNALTAIATANPDRRASDLAGQALNLVEDVASTVTPALPPAPAPHQQGAAPAPPGT